MSKITLGATYRCKVTGFEGVATGHVEYITGCHQTLLQPGVDKDGNLRGCHWFDDQRLEEIVFGDRVELDNSDTPGFGPQAPKR